ncbi:MAG: DUF1887 family protein [Ktedonobacteraceae bacterium]|nr:DUF1887 family protein [Ktedonobacteraceae bacterium]
MSKALLILFGGRSMPNMLTIIHEKPALIVAIVSWDQQNKLPQLTDAITELFKDNELDVTMMYKAKLLVAECKTGNAFDAETLYKLDSIANQLGGRFVGRMLVTSLPIPAKDREAEKQYEKLKDRAEVRAIRIVTREELANIQQIIKDIAMKSVRI